MLHHLAQDHEVTIFVYPMPCPQCVQHNRLPAPVMTNPLTIKRRRTSCHMPIPRDYRMRIVPLLGLVLSADCLARTPVQKTVWTRWRSGFSQDVAFLQSELRLVFFASGTACAALAERGPPLKVRMYRTLLNCVEEQSTPYPATHESARALRAFDDAWAIPLKASHGSCCALSLRPKVAVPCVAFGERHHLQVYGPSRQTCQVRSHRFY